MQLLEHLRNDNNLHGLSFNLYLKRKFSFMRPKVYAKFLCYCYVYFLNLANIMLAPLSIIRA